MPSRQEGGCKFFRNLDFASGNYRAVRCRKIIRESMNLRSCDPGNSTGAVTPAWLRQCGFLGIPRGGPDGGASKVYKGLDIVTAKVTPAEKQMAPHHMLDIVDPLTNFKVIDFRDMALPIIDNLLARRCLPIIVGGTNYYIESLLWEILLTDPKTISSTLTDPAATNPIESRSDDRYNIRADWQNDDDEDDATTPAKRSKFDTRMCDDSNEELHRKLMEIDPEMARTLHPNNRRKVIR
ncbi:tRNA dimethylallyltransferase, mitochondrial [Ooceraea biroi]|uniref:tRNA dimethylallyltransferase, mitochondrial n=1 Tax=Ooceraea biroi TaxID=2015173 RepID=A0A026WG53_OOCBI|nr:tRNA dimethylallyltransferase, mitochondrial [Ooceraea biroi]